MRRGRFAALVAIATLMVPSLSLSQVAAPSVQASDEARQRFDRGLRLFNAGDDPGALAEFKRAFELSGSVVALYNQGLVYAEMGRAVEATEVLSRVLASPGSLSPARLALARRRRDELAASVAEIALSVSVEGASVEVDGVEVAKTPLAAPLHVTSGAHVIGAIASGFEPARKEITIAGRETQSLALDLVAMQGRLAHLAVKTHLPGADVFADDHRVARTPLLASIALAPGKHRIELRREGYRTARAEVALDDGASGEMTLEPEQDPDALAWGGGQLALDASETAPVVTVDGRTLGVYTGPLRLPGGPHHLLVERGDFEPVERDVVVSPGSHGTVVRVVFEPTPDYRARYVAHAQAARTWGIVSVVGGVALAAAGAGLLVYDAGQRSDGYTARNALLAQNALGQVCDPGSESFQQTCANPANAAGSQVNDANTRDYAGWAAIGVGGAAVALGFALVATGGNPGRYDVPSSEPALAASRLRVRPTGWTVRGGGGVGVVGSF